MANLLSELEAVDRLCAASREAGGKFNIEGTEQFVDYSLKLLALYRDHHAEIAAAVMDAERLMYAFQADGFTNVEKDRYDYAMDCCEENGRDEPNAEDELNGVRRLIDAAMSAREGV